MGLLLRSRVPRKETSVERGLALSEWFLNKETLPEGQALSQALGPNPNKLQICLVSSLLSTSEQRLGTGPSTGR